MDIQSFVKTTSQSPVWMLVGYIFAITIMFGIGILFSACFFFLYGMSKLVFLAFSSVVIYTLLFGTTVTFAKFVHNTELANIGLPKHISFKQLALGALLPCVLLPLQIVVCLQLNWLVFTPTNASWVLGAVLALECLLIGLTEEVIFRGYLLYAIEKWKGRTVAIILTSIMFWLLHIPNGSEYPYLACIAFVMFGVAQCLTRYAFGSLYFAIAFHAVYDWIVLAAGQGGEDIPGYFIYKVTAPTWLLGAAGDTGLLDIAIPFVGLLVASLYAYNKSKKD